MIVEPTCEQLETFASPGQFGKLELMVLLNFHLPELVDTIGSKKTPFQQNLSNDAVKEPGSALPPINGIEQQSEAASVDKRDGMDFTKETNH